MGHSEELQQGRDAWLEFVYREHFAFVWGNLRRLGVASADLEDAVQEVFVVVHRRRCPEGGTALSLRAWLYGILRRVAANRRRAQSRRQRVMERFYLDQDGDETAANERCPGRAFERKQRASELSGLLDRLSPELRDALILFDLEQMSGREVSAVLGIPAGTAFSRRRCAREQIGGWLRREQFVEEQREVQAGSAPARRRVWAQLAVLPPTAIPYAAVGSGGAMSFSSVLATTKGIAAAALGAVATSFIVAFAGAPPLSKAPEGAAMGGSARADQTPQAARDARRSAIVVSGTQVEPALEAPKTARPIGSSQASGRENRRVQQRQTSKAAELRRRTEALPVKSSDRDDDSLGLSDESHVQTFAVAGPNRRMPSTQLRRQTAIVADARNALAAGQLARAEAQINLYRQAFPGGVYAQESRWLELRVSCARGQDLRAQRLYRNLVDHASRAHPSDLNQFGCGGR